MDPKIREALDLIEASQSLMLEAAQTICPVDGFGNEWSATCAMYEKIKQHWHKVNNRRMDLIFSRARQHRRAAAHP